MALQSIGEDTITIAYGYDALGRRTSTTDPRIGMTTTEYDPETGQVIAQIDPEERRTTIEYYPAGHKNAGQVKLNRNADHKTQQFAYNSRGQQIGVWGETQYPIAYDYNEYGERTTMRTYHVTPEGQPSLEEDEGARTTWHFDEATGVLLKKSYADGKGPEYRYDQSGQLVERKWARVGTAAPDQPGPERNTTAYGYDSETGALEKTTYSDGSEINYEYDDSGRLAKVTDATGSREFTYNIRGQVLSETVTVMPPALEPGASNPAPLKYRIVRTYTDLGQPEKVMLAGLDGLKLDHQVEYQWDTRGQLAKVISPAGEFTYEYNQKNPALLDRLTAPAHTVSYAYEPHRNLVTSVKNTANASGETVSEYGYENDLLGRREQITQRGAAFQMLQLHGENTVQVAYNDRSEVTGFNVNRGQDSALAQTYRYDGIGNRERFTSEVAGQKSEVSYQTNDLNQYTGITQRPRDAEWAPQHDLDGNLTEDSRNRYTWSGEDRLTRVESKDRSTLVAYTYDYQGRRTTKRSTKNEEKSTVFIYDGWNLLAEVQGSPSALRSKAPSLRPVTYTWGRDLSGTLQGAGGVGGLLAVSSADDNHRYPCYDANGNIGQMIDNRAVTKAAYH